MADNTVVSVRVDVTIAATFRNHEDEEVKKALSITTSEQTEAIGKLKDLASVISKSTGLLPPNAVPFLKQVASEYSIMNAKITVGLADLGALLTKFIVLAAKVIQSGSMSFNDQQKLSQFGEKLNLDFVKELQDFTDQSRENLINIYTHLQDHDKGGRLQDLLTQRKALEDNVVSSREKLFDIAIKVGALEGEVGSISYEIEMLTKAVTDAEAAKNAMAEERRQLANKIPQYEQEVQNHKDVNYEERGGFWLFSWKVRDVHVDNGERIARENLSALKGRIAAIDSRLDNWNTDKFQEQLKDAKGKLPLSQAKLDAAKKEYELAQTEFEKHQAECQPIISEIKQILEEQGTTSAESIKQVTQLARAVFEGSNSLTATSGSIRTNIQSIDIYPSLLPSSIYDGITMLSICDQYMGTKRLDQVKAILAR